MSRNEIIYMEVVQAHFKLGFSIDEIAKMLKSNLLLYRHQTHEGLVRFTNPKTAAETIIECEKKAHIQALDYNHWENGRN